MLRLDLIGFLAAVLTTLCWLPQAFKTIRTRDTRSLSLATHGVLTVGIGLWLTYGILLGNAPLILANGLSLLLVGTILVMKLRHG